MGCVDDGILEALRDGKLAAEKVREVREHLGRCAECRRRALALHPSEPTIHRPPSLADASDVSEVTAKRRTLPPSGLADWAEVGHASVVGRFLVLRELGVGGMGTVYEAYDPELDRKVALKLVRDPQQRGELDSEGRERLQREARTIARLSHHNVVTIFDVGFFGGQVFMAMELVVGGTVRAWLEERPRSVREIVRAYVEAGRGLAAAHAAGLVHRDFKPDNVLIGTDGRVRVTDFGLARPARSSQEEPGQAEEGPGTLAGTPAYMAPEQAAGREVDARSDQFSFAVSLWEALFGQRPYQVSLTGSGIKADWSPPAVPQGSRVPARIRRALLKALSIDPAARFASMDDLLAALAPSRRRARLLPLAALLLLALGAAGLATVMLRRPSALCSGAEGALAQAMPAPTLAACGDAFAASGLPGAEQIWQRVRAELERYGRAWVSAHVEACEATRVRGEQSEEILDRRMVCLERRRSPRSSSSSRKPTAPSSSGLSRPRRRSRLSTSART